MSKKTESRTVHSRYRQMADSKTKKLDSSLKKTGKCDNSVPRIVVTQDSQEVVPKSPSSEVKTSTPTKVKNTFIGKWDVSEIPNASGANFHPPTQRVKRNVSVNKVETQATLDKQKLINEFQQNEMLLALLATKALDANLEKANRHIQEKFNIIEDSRNSKKSLLEGYERDIQVIKSLQERGCIEEKEAVRLDHFGDTSELTNGIEKLCREIEHSNSILELRNISLTSEEELGKVLDTTKSNMKLLVADSSHKDTVVVKTLNSLTNFNQSLSKAHLNYKKCEKKRPQMDNLLHHESSMKATIDRNSEEEEGITKKGNDFLEDSSLGQFKVNTICLG